MKLQYLATLLPQQEGSNKICSLACTPNGVKLAVVGNDRLITLIDEKGDVRDRFSSKSIDSKYGKKSYVIKSVCFSPDSSRLAVAQTDNVVYVYKVGESWTEKKVIVNKLPQSAATTVVQWPFDDKLLIGLRDGKLRVGILSSNKCTSLYKTDEPVVSLSTNPRRTAFVSGHQDGSIIHFTFSSKTQVKICSVPGPPFCLAYTAHGIIAVSDRRVFCYTENGIVQQQFDFNSQNEKEFSAVAMDFTGNNVVLGSFNRIRLFSWSSRRGAWEEGNFLDIPNLYACTAIAWKADGSVLYCGTLCGGVISIDCCLRRGMLNSRFETTYVAPSHVIVRDVNSGTKTNLVSQKGYAIENLKMIGKDRFMVAYTASSLILADSETGLSSEIDWQSGGNEKFYFEFAHVCVIVNVGEITVVEYGVDGPLGWVRTELTSRHLISVSVTKGGPGSTPMKKIAYLTDPTSLTIKNLMNDNIEVSITHTTTIDWLELSETATKLLFRDKRSRLFLLDGSRQSSLLNFCTYVQWVPGSDTIVAQSGNTLHVWYNPALPDQVTTITIKGEIESVLRDAERTEVIVQEDNAKVAYELDNVQIDFGSALESGDLNRASAFLDHYKVDDAYSMWNKVAQMASEQKNFFVAQRCFAALNEYPRARAAFRNAEMAEVTAKEIGGDGTQHWKIRANAAQLMRNFKEAENIYLKNNAIEEAIEMYQLLQKWDEALSIAKAVNYPGFDQLKANYYRTLFDTGRDAKAAELKIADGDIAGAVSLYVKAKKPVQALETALTEPSLANNHQLMTSIASQLMQSQIYDKAGELFEHMKDFEKALECYTKGQTFNKAIQLARFAAPEKVVQLEEQWGDHLVSEGQHDASISHFLEANSLIKAAEAAIEAKEWGKALQIVDVIRDSQISSDFYGRIAAHYATTDELDRAERLYLEANLQKEAIAMYIKNNRWADAYRLSEEFLGKEETIALYEAKAEELEEQGRYADAEQLYVSIGMSNRAVLMYKNADRNDDVIRLVEKYHGEHLQETHKRLGMEHEERGDLRSAEEEYLKADDIKAAINMYREKEMWTDAYRLARSEGGEQEQKQVALLWAKSLGGEAGVKLLNKFGMLNEAIDHFSEIGTFDFAFELARLGAKERLPGVHMRMAVQMEEEGRLDQAAQHFIAAGKPAEAVAMYVHDGDWRNAEQIAIDHSPESLPDVFIAEARKALEEEDTARAESCLLRANRPDIILKYYQESGMWPDALRIAKEYLPHQLLQLQEEFEQVELLGGGRGVSSLLAQGRAFEEHRDWVKAVQAYLKVDYSATDDETVINTALMKSADLALRFLANSDEEIVLKVVEALEAHKDYGKMAELLLAIGQNRQAVMALARAQQWSKAKQVASEFVPEMVSEVEAQYKEWLTKEGRVGELIDVDVISAIDLLIAKGQWDKALDAARQQKHKPLLEKYVAQYAAELLSQNHIDLMLNVFEKYGASSNPANFNLYKAIVDKVVSQSFSSPSEEYARLSPVRNLFLSVYELLEKENSESRHIFERYVHALHLMTIRCAMEEIQSVDSQRFRLQQSISLLRYSDLIPADRVFYQAGMAAKETGGDYAPLAFLLLNHYLDLVDAIDEGDASLVDYSAFEGTDIPSEVPLPESSWIEGSVHEEVKEWVLATSVDDGASRDLKLDSRGLFEATIEANGQKWPECIITGYPITRTRIDFGDLSADKDNLNRFLIAIKTNPTDQLINVQEFMSKWAHAPLNMSL
uniref:Intraflagellar transport protein n=1 Tax=Haemonchus contortus TaxID=6289 RepID=A0A7I4Y1E8_HAECO|nr:intraflagellar transport protein 172 homolog [Haemonchus contortus]